jgi:hypothetical protein
MNSSDSLHRHAAVHEDQIAELLADVRLRFYTTSHMALFQRDRRRLVYALTWPAVWLDRRSLFCSSQRYRSLIVDRLDAIRAHGEPARYGAYFPTYLLKCLQDFFDRHGDDLYHEFKHVRNALDQLRGSLRFAEKVSTQSRQIEALAAAHRMLRAAHSASLHSDPGQLALF